MNQVWFKVLSHWIFLTLSAEYVELSEVNSYWVNAFGPSNYVKLATIIEINQEQSELIFTQISCLWISEPSAYSLSKASRKNQLSGTLMPWHWQNQRRHREPTLYWFFGQSLNYPDGILRYSFISNLCRIFRLRGVHKMFGGGPIFRGWNEILLLGKALKFGVIFQKLALKLIKICKMIGKIREKCKFYGNFFKFSGRQLYEK